ncbi:MAG TPA: flavin reductase family protein [Candidatus Kapabacteria bacterium]|nr:flavin reductase family protein [Candidatus Kapabacteria bacterium]
MKTFDPSQIPFQETHRLLLGGVAPRPIAFVSSLDADGNVNLAPFSFFNAFGVNPPVICFSPAFSGRTGAPKDTLLNILETKECTVSIISYNMVHQTSLASAPFAKGVDEFSKAGFTKLPSQKVKAPGVSESPFVMEAKLLHHIDFGKKPGSANMLICEIVLLHIREDILNDKEQIDPRLIDQVARLGGPWYTRAAHGLFTLPQPTSVKHGFDELPPAIRNSLYLSGSDLAKLLDVEELPDFEVANKYLSDKDKHLRAKELIENGDIDEAWKVLLR